MIACLMAAPLAILAILYSGGFLGQILGNYAAWKQGGGVPGDGTSPVAASPDFFTCLTSVLRPPYGVYGVLICIGLLAILLLMVMKMGYHGFLFRNRSGYFLSAHNINRAIERISIAYNAEEMDQAELEDREPNLLPHFSVHNLRHTFCTRLCEKTNDIKFIQQVMGHADFSTTMDIYTHITQESMKEKAEVIKDDLVLM